MLIFFGDVKMLWFSKMEVISGRKLNLVSILGVKSKFYNGKTKKNGDFYQIQTLIK